MFLTSTFVFKAQGYKQLGRFMLTGSQYPLCLILNEPPDVLVIYFYLPLTMLAVVLSVITLGILGTKKLLEKRKSFQVSHNRDLTVFAWN